MGTLNGTDAALAGRLVVGLRGPVLGADERVWLESYRPAGVVLFGRNVTGPRQLTVLCEELHGILGPDAEIVADQEGGPVSVLAAALGRPPSAAALGRLNDPDLTERVHRDSAARMGEAGITRVLAPCCDVLLEPRNAVIGARAFGSDAGSVAVHVGAAVRGLRAGGLDVCPKHWPGHGGTRIDTHLGAVTAAVAPDLDCYLAAVDAGADALMLGHLPLTDGGAPASLDPAARDEVTQRFAGLAVWSDDVTMAAVRGVLASRTGVDPGGTGMVDPGAYPLAWLRNAGRVCDRLLIRGIPWSAFPFDGEQGSTGGCDVDDTQPAGAPRSWREARRRCVDDPLDAGAPLCWFDRTGEHRWGGLEENCPAIAGHVGALRRFDDLEPGAESIAGETLLLTSHRPLETEEAKRLGGGPAPSRIIVLGHPSLGTDAAAVFSPQTRISRGFDASCEELAAWLR